MHIEGFSIHFIYQTILPIARTLCSIGLVFWAQRMFLLIATINSDIIERAFYKPSSGLSFRDSILYCNRLEGLIRPPWQGCACCRQLSGYSYYQAVCLLLEKDTLTY